MRSWYTQAIVQHRGSLAFAVQFLSSSDLQTRLTNQLNLQRQQIRESVREAIYAFSAEYDSESVRLGEEDLSGFEYDPDEQANLAKERWNIDDAIEKLRELAEELKMDCVDLGREMRVHEKNLTR